MRSFLKFFCVLGLLGTISTVSKADADPIPPANYLAHGTLTVEWAFIDVTPEQVENYRIPYMTYILLDSIKAMLAHAGVDDPQRKVAEIMEQASHMTPEQLANYRTTFLMDILFYSVREELRHLDINAPQRKIAEAMKQAFVNMTPEQLARYRTEFLTHVLLDLVKVEFARLGIHDFETRIAENMKHFLEATFEQLEDYRATFLEDVLPEAEKTQMQRIPMVAEQPFASDTPEQRPKRFQEVVKEMAQRTNVSNHGTRSPETQSELDFLRWFISSWRTESNERNIHLGRAMAQIFASATPEQQEKFFINNFQSLPLSTKEYRTGEIMRGKRKLLGHPPYVSQSQII